MHADTVKTVVERWVEEMWNQHRAEAPAELLTPDAVVRMEHAEYRGIAAIQEVQAKYLRAFPDLNAEIEDLVVEGNNAVTRIRYAGTHKEEMLGIPPTGERLEFHVIDWVRVEGDKIAEIRVTWDLLYILRAENERLRQDLEQLLAIVPICAGCKDVRDQEGQWERVESYLSRRQPIQLSHGLCPQCLARLYPDYVDCSSIP